MNAVDEFTVEHHIESRGAANGIVVGVVAQAHVFDLIGNEGGQVLMVGLGVEDEGPIVPIEPVVDTRDQVERSLGADVGVDLALQVPHFAVKGRLPIPPA